MRVLVYGGRDFTDTESLYKYLDKFHEENLITIIIEGDARGADRIAGHWARKNRIDLLVFKAQWDTLGKAAGFIRNKQMRDEGRPDVGIQCPGGKGTEMMRKLLEEKGIPVYDITS